jgi:lactoylglutathione lyase
MHIEHVALWCRDLAIMQAFFERWFAAQAGVVYHNPAKAFRSVFLHFGNGARLELMQREGMDQTASGDTLGYAHLAFSLGSKTAVDEQTQRMLAAGLRLLDGPRQTGDGYYESLFLDPEGNRLELTV